MLPRVTSLFDLLNKAKTRKPYQLLTIQIAQNIDGRKVKTMEDAIKTLERIAEVDGSCSEIVREANYIREIIQDDELSKQSQLGNMLRSVKLSDLPMANFQSDTTAYERSAVYERARQEAMSANFTAQQVRNEDHISWGFPEPIEDGRILHPGDMVEYGWYDQEIENALSAIQAARGVTRYEALNIHFNPPPYGTEA